MVNTRPTILSMFGWLCSALLLGAPSPAAAQCPPPVQSEIGGTAFAVLNSTSGYQALGRGRFVQLVQTSVSPPVVRGLVGLDEVVVAMHEQIVGQLWVVDSHTLYGLNTNNPASPQIVGRFSLSPTDSIRSLRVVGSYAYVVSDHALSIVDITNPAAPILRSTFTLPGAYFEDVEVVGSYAYLAASLFPAATFVILDVSNPTQPFEVSRAGTSVCNRLAMVPGNASIFAIVQESTTGLRRVERWVLSTPTAPTRQAASNTIGDPETTSLNVTFNAVSTIHWTPTGDPYVRILDPVTLGEVALSPPLHAAATLSVEWPYLYVARWTGGMHRISIVDAFHPVTTANYFDSTPGYVDDIGGTNSGFTVMCGGEDAWFFTNPPGAAPAMMLHIVPPAGSYITRVATESNVAFVLRYNTATANTTIMAYQYTGGPPTMTLVGQLNITGGIGGFDIGSDPSGIRRLFLTVGSDMSSVLYVLNAQNLAVMSVTSTTALTAGVASPVKYVSGSFILGLPHRVLVSGYHDKTQLLSVESPSAPSTLGIIPAGSFAIASSFGTYVWMVMDNVLFAYDIATPAVPTLLSTLKLPGEGRNFCFIGAFAGLAGVVTYDGKLVLINTGSPSAPSLYRVANIGFFNEKMAFDGTLLHIASGEAGYRTLPYDFPAPPVEDPNAPLLPTAICPGSPLTLRATFVAAPAISSYHWYKNGALLADGPSGSGSVYSGATTATLVVNPPAAAAAGLYACVGTNSCGPAAVSAPVTFCYANCDCSIVTPILNVNDFQCFLNRFAAGDAYANCDASTIPPVLNVNDFNCFLNRFAAGCP